MDIESFKQAYWRQGFCVVENVFSPDEVAAMRASMDEIEERAVGLTESDDVFDLEKTHTPETPRIRRIKRPHDAHKLFREFAGHDKIMRYVEALVGPDIRLIHSKINQKTAEYGAPLEWHQDWAFIPHTNRDLVITAVMLDDCTERNGPVLYVPESHRGPLYNHHHNGTFYGAIDIDGEGVPVDQAVPALGPAGSVMFHHTMTIHGSALNKSAKDRALLFYEYAAADAWPLFTAVDYPEFDARMVCGQSCFEPRLEPVFVRMPVGADTKGQIYAIQESFEKKFFETYAAG